MSGILDPRILPFRSSAKWLCPKTSREHITSCTHLMFWERPNYGYLNYVCNWCCCRILTREIKKIEELQPSLIYPTKFGIFNPPSQSSQQAGTLAVGMRPRDKQEKSLPYKHKALMSSSVQVRSSINREPTKLFLRLKSSTIAYQMTEMSTEREQHPSQTISNGLLLISLLLLLV